MTSNQKKTLLIVDDTPSNIQALAQILHDSYSILIAKNGVKAIEIAKSKKPDLILLDIEMPEMDGYAVCHALKEIDTAREIPIIFVTARTDEYDEKRGFELGAVDYIKKPYQSKIILTRIRTHLRIQCQQDELRRVNKENLRHLGVIDRYVITSSTNLNGAITDVSEAFCKISGYTKEELVGQTHKNIKSGKMSPQVYQDLWEKITHGKVWQGEMQNQTKQGEDFWLEMTILPELDERGEVTRYTAISTDITAKKIIERMAELDKLTKLYNRVKLDSVLEYEYSRSMRYGNPLSVVLMDIDYFKSVNDTYGHQTGDNVLRELAHILRGNVRKTDVAGRWGGEEFMIICIESDIESAAKMAEHLRKSIENHEFETVGQKTASFGVAQLQQKQNIAELIEVCDQTLYQAKKEGRNRVCRN